MSAAAAPASPGERPPARVLALPGQPRLPAGALAAPAGALAAALHFAGALKSAPILAALPFDLTLASAAALAAPLLFLALTRRWALAPAAALPLAAAAGLWFWMVVGGAWSASRDAAGAKLPELVLMAPAMLAIGLMIGADARSLARFALATLAMAALVGASVAIGIADRSVILGGLVGADPERVRVQYQVTGLLLASGATLATIFALERRGAARLALLALALALAGVALLPGGRAGLLALVVTLALSPALLFWRRGQPLTGLAWPFLVLGGGAAALALLLTLPGLAEGFRTLERLTQGSVAEESGRLPLWRAAFAWVAEAPLGLGAGAFGIATGSGDTRRFHPHNLGIEALVEGGWPGLILWLGAFGGAGLAMVAGIGRASPGRAARIAALVLPMAITILVSTDLGNRMAWLALGLALSLRLEARDA